MIRLTGAADYARLLKTPAVEATIDAGESAQTAPASFQRVGSNYEIVVNTSWFPPTGNVSVRLSFDSFFVRKATKTVHDDRELVVKAPELVQLLRQQQF
jgi:hypothetical protein